MSIEYLNKTAARIQSVHLCNLFLMLISDIQKPVR